MSNDVKPNGTYITTWGSAGTRVEAPTATHEAGAVPNTLARSDYYNNEIYKLATTANYNLRKGVPEWDATKTYAADDVVEHNGKVWTALSGSLNSEPSDVNANWDRSLYISEDSVLLRDGSKTLTGAWAVGGQSISGVNNLAATSVNTDTVSAVGAGPIVSNNGINFSNNDLTFINGISAVTATLTNIQPTSGTTINSNASFNFLNTYNLIDVNTIDAASTDSLTVNLNNLNAIGATITVGDNVNMSNNNISLVNVMSAVTGTLSNIAPASGTTINSTASFNMGGDRNIIDANSIDSTVFLGNNFSTNVGGRYEYSTTYTGGANFTGNLITQVDGDSWKVVATHSGVSKGFQVDFTELTGVQKAIHIDNLGSKMSEWVNANVSPGNYPLGTRIWAATNGSTAYSFGQTTSGANLDPAGIYGIGTLTNSVQGTSLPGTWKCCGFSPAAGGRASTYWERVL